MREKAQKTVYKPYQVSNIYFFSMQILWNFSDLFFKEKKILATNFPQL